MITLRVKEVAEDKGLTLNELSNFSGVPLEEIQSYTIIENLTDEIAANLRKIAAKLDVTVFELVKPVAKRIAFKLNITEVAKKKGIAFEELVETTGIHPSILAFYSTQAISAQKLEELELKNQYLQKISEVIDCNSEDLKIKTDLPIIKLDFEELVKERCLSLTDISVIANVPVEFIDLIVSQNIEDPNQNIDLFSIVEGSVNFLAPTVPITDDEPVKVICEWIKNISGQEIWFCPD